jgi:hypothetical protein
MDMDKLLAKLGVSSEIVDSMKPVRREKTFQSVKANTYPHPGYNYMADLLFLPDDGHGYRYCLVVVDLWSDAFDIEPIKNKQPGAVVDAIKRMWRRPYLSEPMASVQTDSGNEFKGAFSQYLRDENIIKRTALPNRHKQMANVERLNRELGRLFNGYMNVKEQETEKVYRGWTDVVPDVRKLLNGYRTERRQRIMKHEAMHDEKPIQSNMVRVGRKRLVIDQMSDSATPLSPKYRVGDLVHRKLDRPMNALGEYQPTERFREGDLRWDPLPKKVVAVLSFPSNRIPFRYVLEGYPNVSYTDAELKPSTAVDATYVVERLLDEKRIDGVPHVLVKWKGWKVKDSTWESKQQLLDDGFEKEIKELETRLKQRRHHIVGQ